MIERAKDAEFINAILNHPEVRPFIYGRPGPLDVTNVVGNPAHLVLTGKHGGIIFIQHIIGLWEIHTAFLPSGRGVWGLQFAQEAGDWLFSRTNATEIFTRIPEGNIGALALARAGGMMLEHKVPQPLGDGTLSQVSIYGGRIQDWIRIAPGLVDRGKAFHARLHAKYEDLGLGVDVHDQDDWHDRHVGAAVGMITGGQIAKGVAYFNRWAAMAMAPQMKVLSTNPLRLDISDCVLRIESDDFEVEPCRVV